MQKDACLDSSEKSLHSEAGEKQGWRSPLLSPARPLPEVVTPVLSILALFSLSLPFSPCPLLFLDLPLFLLAL